MSTTRRKDDRVRRDGRALSAVLLLALCWCSTQPAGAQAAGLPGAPTPTADSPTVTPATPAPTTPPVIPAHVPAAGEVLDRVVAVVNGEVILESDVDEERRFAAFQPISAPSGDFSRARAIERLVNRALILQQAKLQPQPPITDEDVDKELMQIRRESPACKPYACETDAGWQRFVAAQGFTLPELMERWRQRMETLRFIELRFRAGVHIPQDEIEAYYTKTLLPEYGKRGVKVPKLDDTLSERIQEVLLQEQVSSLLSDWLKSLRVQGSVEIMNAEGTGPA